MATTAGGLPYVESSDLISGYPTVSQALAEELDDQLAAKAALAGATYTGTHDFSGATVSGVGGLSPVTSASFSSVASVSVDNCFSSSYQNYRIVLAIYSASSDQDVSFRFRTGGVTNTAANYTYQRLTADGTSVTATRTTGATDFRSMYSESDGSQFVLDCMLPYASYRTALLINGNLNRSSYVYGGSAVYNTTTSFDGFTFGPISGTFSGVVMVYGYGEV